MTNPTIPGDGAAMPAEGCKTRRALLTALAGVPALAIAVASPSSSSRLAGLIETHRTTQSVLDRAAEAFDTSDLDPDTLRHYSFLGEELSIYNPHGLDDIRGRLIEAMEVRVAIATNMLSPVSKWLSPELGEAARRELERGKNKYLSQIDAVFTRRAATSAAYSDAHVIAAGALTALCAHRCASTEEVATKLRYLMSGPVKDELLESDQIEALLASFLPEGEEIEVV